MKDQRQHETPASIFIHAGQNHTWEILQQCASASLQQIGQDITLALQNLFSAPALVNDVNDQIKIMTLVCEEVSEPLDAARLQVSHHCVCGTPLPSDLHIG